MVRGRLLAWNRKIRYRVDSRSEHKLLHLCKN